MDKKSFLAEREPSFLYEKDNILQLKQFVDLHDIVVKFEKVGSKLVFYHFYGKNNVTFSLKALVWNKKLPLDYEFVTSSLNIDLNQKLNNEQLKWYLMFEIYKKVIKKKIMMI